MPYFSCTRVRSCSFILYLPAASRFFEVHKPRTFWEILFVASSQIHPLFALPVAHFLSQVLPTSDGVLNSITDRIGADLVSRKIEQAREEKAAADELGVSVSPALISDLVREVDTLTLRGLRKAVLFHRLRFEPPLLQHYTSLGLARPPPPPPPPHQGMVERPHEDMERPFEPFFAAQDTVGGLPWLAEDLTGVAEVRKREEGIPGRGG